MWSRAPSWHHPTYLESTGVIKDRDILVYKWYIRREPGKLCTSNVHVYLRLFSKLGASNVTQSQNVANNPIKMVIGITAV